MERLRRAALTAAALWVVAPAATQVPVGAIKLHAASAPSGLLIDNPGDRPVLIRRAIGVEQQVGTQWRPLSTELNAVGACTPGNGTGPVRLRPHASLSIVPWRGGSCSGQCNRVCRANIDYPPGRFRYVVTVLPGQGRVVGPVLAMDRSIR